MARNRSDELKLELSQQIVDLCKKQNWPVGQRLTERDLAERFNVSRSPVRSALEYLAGKGVISRKPRSGYYLAIAGGRIDKRLGAMPQGTAESLYIQILRDRFAGVIPAQMSEADFMRHYAVKRGLLLKVLMRLSHEGFIHRGQGHGWIFREILSSVAAYQASYEFRLAVEPAALRSSHFKIDRQKLDRLYDMHKKILDGKKKEMTGIEHFDLDAELHETLASFSGNQFFVEAMRYHNRLRRVVEYESFYADERMTESCEEHLQILNALRKGDREWAATLMTRHLRLASEAVAVFHETADAGEENRPN